MSGNCQRGSELSSSADCQLSQDSDEDDVSNGELWNPRPLQHQVGYLSLSGGFAGSLSPQPSSSIECVRRVSPLDPNLSSAARYSPPPPYNSSIEDIDASIVQPSSPLGDLANANSLPSLPASVSSSISRLSNSAGFPSISRPQDVSGSNSLFSSPPASSLRTQPKWTAPRLTYSSENFQNQVRPPAESIWAKQKRLASSNSSQVSVSESNSSNLSHLSHHEPSSMIISQPGSSGLQDPAVPGPSSFKRMVPSDSSSLPKIILPAHKSPKAGLRNLNLTARAGPSGLQSLSYFSESDLKASIRSASSGAVSNSFQDVALSHRNLSAIKNIPLPMLPKAVDSNSSDEEEEPAEMLDHPEPSVVQNHINHLNDCDAEALVDMVSGCEASSNSGRGRMSPLRSPCTPPDSCIVSSSTGHIDSIPPTPVEFQGNDVSEPSSPVSPNLACGAIIDSTVDSTSGRGIIDPVEPSSEDDSDEDLVAVDELPLPGIADEGGEITTSEAVLQNSDDSQDVALLVSPQGMFTSGRASDSRFIEQLSLTLSQFPSNSLDASLSAVDNERCDSNIPPSNSISYLDDQLSIPGPSRLSLADLQASTSGDQSLGQPSTSGQKNIVEPEDTLESSLPLLDITVGLSRCCPEANADHLMADGKHTIGSSMESLGNNKSSNAINESIASASRKHSVDQLNNLHQSYPLSLHDDNSFSSDALSSTSLGKDLSERSINIKGNGKQAAKVQEKEYYDAERGILCNVPEETPHSLLNTDQLVTRSLDGSIDLNLSSSAIAVSVALPVSSQGNSLSQQLLESQPDQVSLLVGGGDESTDGALLMMVSADGQALSNALSLGKHGPEGETSSAISALSHSDNQILSSQGVDQDLQNISFDKTGDEEEAVESKPSRSKDLDGYVEAKFWCGECGEMYKSECPHHGMRKTDRGIKTRALKSLPSNGNINMKTPADVEECLKCDQKLEEPCSHYEIQAICDKPVQTRAWASLPAQHLAIRCIPLSEEYGVFARKFIPKRTRFGPLEGILVEGADGASLHNLNFTIRSEDAFLMVDTSDEDCSNWMRFVRKATTYMEQNCVVIQIDEALYFLSSADIQPRTELKVGYSKQYADRRHLDALEPTKEEIAILDSMRKSWPCYECDEGFETSADLQMHLTCHDEDNNKDDKKKRKRMKTRHPRRSIDAELRVVKRAKLGDNYCLEAESLASSDRSVEVGVGEFLRSQCLTCNIIFAMPELLKVHRLKHINESLAEPLTIKREHDVQNNSEENLVEEELLRNDRALALSLGESSSVLSAEKEEALETLHSLEKTCPQCRKEFDTDEALFSHIEEHGAFHAGSSKPYKCNYCYKSFTRRFRLEAHKTVHGNEAEKPFRCNLCLRKFLSNSALTAHIRFHIEGCKGYDCPICREGFFSMAGLKAHVKSHCVNGEFVCPNCNKIFPSYSKIRRHIRSYHSLMPHTCSLCGKEMPSVDKLKIHMLSHSDRRDFLCPDCGKRFKRKDKLKEHSKRMHSGERQVRAIRAPNKGSPKFVPKVDPADYKRFLYKCTTCLLGFKRRGMLVNHLAKRHPNVDMKCVPELNQPILKANQTFKCQYCDKRYRSSSKRKLHILKYHPGAELPPRVKAISDNDTSEGSSYTSSYPHPCNWCYRQYASRGRLLRHQRHHHPSHTNNDEEGTESSSNNIAFLDGSSNIAGELSLNGQLVDVNILRNHRLANIVRASSPASTEGDGGNEEDLLTQAMGEITPLTARPLLVNGGGGGQQGATLALVAAEGPNGVTLSLPNCQFISLIPGLSVTSAPSAVSSSRTGSEGGSTPVDGSLQRAGAGPSMRVAYTLGSSLGQSSSEAEAVQQVVLAAQQPSSPTSQVVWSI